MMARPTLPRDVLSIIVDSGSFTKHELCAIALASPHLRHEAQRELFRDPGKHHINVGADSNARFTASSFLHTVISSPDRLALMVRRYHVTLSWHDFVSPKNSDEQRIAQNTVFNRLSRGLPLMTRLTELQFYTDKTHGFGPVRSRPPSITSILKRCTFRLEVLRCSYLDVGPKDQKIIEAFLRDQHGMRELWLLGIDTPRSSSESQAAANQYVCPSVVSIGGRPKISMCMLLSGQRVQHICWEGFGLYLHIDFLPKAQFGSVVLMETFSFDAPLDLQCLAFRNLMLLKTKANSQIFEQQEMLSTLTRLCVLLITFDPRYPHIFTRFLTNEEQHIRRLFSSSLSLQNIEVHNHEGGRKYVIDRVTPAITVYVVPAGMPLNTGERYEELLERVPVRIGPDDVFLKTISL